MRTTRLLAVALALLIATSAATQVPPERAQKTADAAIGRLRSPFCPGLMLEVCPSPNAEALRDTIRMMAAQGHGADAIVENVLARHGDEWRAVPRRSGAGLWAWLIPPFALLLGGVFLWGRLRAMRAQGRVHDARENPAVTDEERARLEAALREFEAVEDRA